MLSDSRRARTSRSNYGLVDVDAGVNLDQLMKAAPPFGLWVPVPGTRQVTYGSLGSKGSVPSKTSCPSSGPSPSVSGTSGFVL